MTGYNTRNPYQQYQRTAVETGSRGQLVVMLYQGAIRFLARARGHFETGNIEQISNNIIRAQEIIAELLSSLDREVGGEVADNLAALYDYMYRRLIESNLEKKPEPIEEVTQLLRTLLPAWQEAVRQEQAERAASGGVSAAARGQG
ncbi:MAG: flagellar export chaperone FliS [Dehalococcoidia bacterium]|nr:flagellar export chaperone FliS [Dehalococcoidia bacterium]